MSTGMRHTWQVFSYELLRSVRKRRYLFTTFGIPLIAIALLFAFQFISSRSAQDEQSDVEVDQQPRDVDHRSDEGGG